MSSTLYFKDMTNKDDNNQPNIIYRVEEHKLFLEILDRKSPMGCPIYFSSIRKRDNYLIDRKEHLLRINNKEVNDIIDYWKTKH
ncbi:MAG: hypothetical protein ACI4SR_09200 [Faecalibacillus sp.]